MRTIARLVAVFCISALGLAGCIGGHAGNASYRVLNDPLYDYYYGTVGSPTDDDPVFIEGWDIDGS